MPTLSDLEKKERYYEIFCQIYEDPRVQIYEIVDIGRFWRQVVEDIGLLSMSYHQSAKISAEKFH